MILPVVKYGHPALRQRGARIESVNAELKKHIADMFGTMYTAIGVGLAAQQVARALQVTVIDVRGITDRPSSIEADGKPADVLDFMPLVLINPEVKPAGDAKPGPEGCLSFPEIFADSTRPEFADGRALNEKGKPISFRAGGLLARAIQHEVDHLQGILFIDRMDKKTKEELRPQLNDLQATTKAALQSAKGKP